jgi:hypothetical protein
MFFTEVPRRKRQRAGVRAKRGAESGRRKRIVPLPLVVFAVGRGTRANHIGPKTSVKDWRVLRPKIALLPFDYAV